MINGGSAQTFDGRDMFENGVISLVKRATERMMIHIERVTLGSYALGQTQ